MLRRMAGIVVEDGKSPYYVRTLCGIVRWRARTRAESRGFVVFCRATDLADSYAAQSTIKSVARNDVDERCASASSAT